MGRLDTTTALSWIRAAADAITAHEAELTELDTAIGDGDHGANLRRGFSTAALAAERSAAAGQEPGAFLVDVGGALISSVGGASGPLYGTALRAAGKALPGPDADTAALAAALQAGLDALCRLGGAAVGDKTMVDAFAPAVTALQSAATDDLSQAALLAADAAEAGMRATTPLRARKGRASYLGERSIGHQDPGATSTALIFRALADALTSDHA
ncbi:dihydroxyacetone kinase subunit DhaL [Yinghuangia seranimata]|uniref:dihydroxyacetone kinase subunit DhaL n=1 Tax=Yinghuangia seranimata TaxID=408067 RepID=UPI00248D2563|nr:dihydroxyacetone kinase subunit DhaL [Yinghuangia seranimata]MDI2130264.1 dihydroxyacetone kinase subunit DhaL [Yinghuangia seranimata]